MIRRTLDYQPLTVSQLKAKIAKLEQDKEQLRLLLHELMEVFYKVISQAESQSKILCLKCIKSWVKEVKDD